MPTDNSMENLYTKSFKFMKGEYKKFMKKKHTQIEKNLHHTHYNTHTQTHTKEKKTQCLLMQNKNNYIFLLINDLI